jgi:predicted aminopeptidase
MKKFLCRVFLVTSALLIGGCAQLGYYAQAMQGQISLMSSAKPIDQWLTDPHVSEDLKVRLARTRQIRSFAANELSLPDNGSYKSYADLKRPFVMWNVVATPEMSMKPVPWCFPVAGCVDYRGYYRKEDAQRFADELRAQGFDVQVSGVPAYSTLGWFNDPLLSTFIGYPEAEVARMVFHELAHQVAYAPGDSPFNEAFATTVEEIGVSLWLDAYGDSAMRERYRIHRQRKQDFMDLLSRYRNQLEENFSSEASVIEKRHRKAALFASLREDYEVMKVSRWAGYAGYDRWFSEPISNAHFALVSTYQDLVPAFQQMYAGTGNFRTFYSRVKALAMLDKAQRRTALEALGAAGQKTGDSPAIRAVATQ